MKLIWPAVAAGLLLWPLSAGAQGYSGVMAPQGGYRAPAPAPAASTGPDLSSPYSGTGASTASGYTSMLNNNESGTPDDAQQDVAPQGDADPPVHPRSPFVDSFAPKAKDDDDKGGSSIYDQADNNLGTATERRRKAIIHKIEASQRKEQEQIKQGSEEHDREVRAFVAKTVKEQRRKMHGDNPDDPDADDDQQDQGTDDASPDSVNQ